MPGRAYWFRAAWVVAGAFGALPLNACGTSQTGPGASSTERSAGGAADGGAGATAAALGGDGTAPAGGDSAAPGAGGTGGAGREKRPESNAGSGGAEDAQDGGSAGAPVDPNPAAFTGPDPFPCKSDDELQAPQFAAQCDVASDWTAAVQVECDAAPGASLVGITPDELTIAWSEPERSMPRYYVADRGSPDEPFGPKNLISVANVVALSPDGLRLVALSDDRTGLLVLARADRGSEFGAESEGEFSELNADAKMKGLGFSSCAFAPDDRSLYYTAAAIDDRYPLRVSVRSDGGAWPVGAALEACEFEAHAGYGRYPSGVSADGKTLFFYDAWRGKARAAFRPSSTGTFSWFRDLGDLFVPQPNAGCDRLYYSVADPDASIVSAPGN